MHSRLLLIMLTVILGGCAASNADSARPGASPKMPPRVNPAAIPPSNPAPPVAGFRAAKVMNIPGLEGIIGQGAAGLQRQFGTPRLDAVEGDVRKLQFRGEACVLDIYLYPQAPGAEPRAAYLDARRSSDGLDVDRVACVNALKSGR